MQAFSDPSRRNDPHALPDIEVFYADGTDAHTDSEGDALAIGFYWWVCLPACLPSSDAYGPFASADEAESDAIAYHADYLD